MFRFAKAGSLLLLGAVLGAGFVVAMQVSSVRVQHEGRCGLQQWVRYVLWYDDSERNYDEFGIPERWARAHGARCESVWIDGPLQAGASEYWPSLHFAIAAGTSWEELESEIDSADDAALKKKDALGRTLMHWAATYGNDRERAALKQKLIERGLSLDDRDSDGLTPRDWEAQYVTSGG